MKWWLGILTGIVAIMFVVILAAYFNGVPYSHNTATLLISVLGVITTALVGWQVFNAIENVKTLKKMEGLENELHSKSELIITLNNQVLDIIEAHHERTVAQGIENVWEDKYTHAIKALKLFISGNIPSDYEPLLHLLIDMDEIINKVNEASQDDKIVFARAFPEYDISHEEILGLIYSRQKSLKSLSRAVVKLRDKRVKLFNDYAKMKTTHEIEKEAKAKPAPPPNPAENK